MLVERARDYTQIIYNYITFPVNGLLGIPCGVGRDVVLCVVR